MAYELVTPKVDTALRTAFLANAVLVAALSTKPSAHGGGAAIYEDGRVPMGATFPYLTIGAYTQIPFHQFAPDGTSGYGYNVTLQLKVVGQTSEATLMGVMNKVLPVVAHGSALTVSGYSHSWTDECLVQPKLTEVIGAVTTFSIPAILRVYVS